MHKYATLVKKGVEAIRGYSMEGGKALLDVSEIALDYLSPTKLANVYLKLTTGETVEDTFKHQDKFVKDTVARSVAQLNKKIEQYTAERDLVHPMTIGKAA